MLGAVIVAFHPAIAVSTDWFSSGAWTAERLIALGTMIVAAGVAFTGIQIRDGRKARNVEFARSLAETWDSPDFRRSRDLMRNHPSGTPEGVATLVQAMRDAIADDDSDDYYDYIRIMNFFEQMGVAFKHHRQGVKVLNQMIGGTIVDYWELWKLVIPELWSDQPRCGENFRDLATKLERKRRRADARRRVWTETRDPLVKFFGISG
jgi:hypothetical protein